MIRSMEFGHKIYCKNKKWYYEEDDTPTTKAKPCPKCKEFPTKEGHDPCIANLPDVSAACCGHGTEPGYVQVFNGNNYIAMSLDEYYANKKLYMDPMTMLYYGTSKAKANKILKKGFKGPTFFFRNLYDAFDYGYRYIFCVAFLDSELPDNWQVLCLNNIPVERICKFIDVKIILLHYNKKGIYAVDRKYGCFDHKKHSFLDGLSLTLILQKNQTQ